MASEEEHEIDQDNSPRLNHNDNTSQKTGEDSQNDTENNIDSKYGDEKENNKLDQEQEEEDIESQSVDIENNRGKQNDSDEEIRMDNKRDNNDIEESDNERQNNEENYQKLEQNKNQDEKNESQEHKSESEDNEEVQGIKRVEDQEIYKEEQENDEEDQKVQISVQELDDEKSKIITTKMKDTFDNEFMSESQSERFNASRKKLAQHHENINAQIKQLDEEYPIPELTPQEENYHLKQQLVHQAAVVNELKEILQEERAANQARNQEIDELKMIVIQLQRNLQNLTQQQYSQGQAIINNHGSNETRQRDAEGLQGLNARVMNPVKNQLNEDEAKYWSECAEFLNDTATSKPLWVEAKETMAENELYGITSAKDQNKQKNQQKPNKLQQDNKSDSASISSITKLDKSPYSQELEKLAIANQKEFAKVYALGKLRMQQIAAQDYQILRQQAQDKRNQMNEMKNNVENGSNINNGVVGSQQNNSNNNRYNKSQISPIIKVDQYKNQSNINIPNVYQSANYENISPPLPVDYYKQFWIEKQTKQQIIQPQQQQGMQSYAHKLSNKELAQLQLLQQQQLQSQLQSIQVNLPPIEQNKQIKGNVNLVKQSPGIIITNQQDNKLLAPQQGSIIQSLEIGSIPSLTKPTNGAGSAPIIKQSTKITNKKDIITNSQKQQKILQDDNLKFLKEQDNSIFTHNQQGIRDKNKVNQSDNLMKADIQSIIITERINKNHTKQQQSLNKGLIQKEIRVDKSNSQRKTPAELKRPYLDRKKHSEHTENDKIAYEPVEQIFTYKQQFQRKI